MWSSGSTNPESSDTTSPTQCEVCSSSSTSVALASVISVIATALLATVIFVLVQIALCKCHPKFTPGGGPKTGDEEVDEGDEEGLPMSDYTYMNVRDATGHENTFQLRENEAYGKVNPFKFTNSEAYAIA